MIVKAQFENTTMLFGDSYKPWQMQFDEWAWLNKNDKSLNLVRVTVSEEHWVSWGGLKWCPEDRFQHQLNREGCQDDESDNQNPRQYSEMQFVRDAKVERKVLKMLDVTPKQHRLNTVNNLIRYISERGHRYFYTNSTLHESNVESVAYMKLKNGRLYFVDNYTKHEVPVLDNGRDWKGFSHGGTLRALVLDFAEFIRTGKWSNGSNGYGGLYCSHWGHSDEIQQEIINYAKDIGYLGR
ncbi:hypothetical protein ACP3VS_22000 [Lysinibacillus sp. VIII_CA]|uniref:hypothetical protein n=1 Tax=Lysinibacillus sp. VIII_CA TaxID=3417452 RepID=UPI003CF9CDC7